MRVRGKTEYLNFSGTRENFSMAEIQFRARQSMISIREGLTQL